MKINTFYKSWGTSRAIVLTWLILFMLVMTIKSYCYTVEMDYSGPGSEFERSMEQYRDKENERASERTQRDEAEGRESSDSDREKASDYYRDHSA